MQLQRTSRFVTVFPTRDPHYTIALQRELLPQVRVTTRFLAVSWFEMLEITGSLYHISPRLARLRKAGFLIRRREAPFAYMAGKVGVIRRRSRSSL